ncbi:PREDICTED: dnaJ homolog subfamily B member 12-like [Camelina sativa]|uniref:DnaJ homolog subfamily B member 12-like n=1 Tax=Camelina sativa TaxID=90675 RepID=A0ABM1QHT3_CAMSA|nr:PREDICTED: dnaJ homolog subfamily B member 12-like [Camelina sativa]
MECNKEEARRAIEMAERKLSESDYDGAKKFINKAHNLYPNLDGLKQGLMMVDVYISASNRGEEEEADWYGILGVDPSADDEAVKKQYKKLALLLHPDKNKLNGAEGAFKLVTEKFINKAHNLYPNLDGLKQGLMMVDVYISASNRGEEEEADWYGILGVDPSADDEAVKKQYKKLALLLHPDKNKLNGAEGAFKLVTEAWCMLSDKVTKTSYDQRRKFKEAKTEMQKQPYPHQPASSGMQKPPNPCEPASYNGNHNA